MGLFDPGEVLPGEITAAPQRAGGFLDSFSLGVQEQYKVNSPYSMEDEIYDRWLDSIANYEKVTGKPTNLPLDYSSINTYARAVKGEDPSFFAQSVTMDGMQVSPELRAKIDLFRQINADMKAQNNPSIRSFDDVFEEVIRMQQGIEEQVSEDSQAGGLGNGVGRFLGNVVGSLNNRDPLTLFTLGLGGVGKSIATRVLTEGAVQAGLTAVTDVAGVNPNRRLAGLEEADPVYDAAAAFFLGAGLRGLGEYGAKFLGDKLDQPVNLDFEDNQLREMLGQMPDTAQNRAVESLLNDAASFRAASPYGQTPHGLLRFTEEIQDVARVLGGETDTAIARVLPPLPEEFILRNDDFKIVKEQSPEIYAKMEEAQASVKAIDERINELNQSIERTTLPDAVRLVDPEVAAKLDELAAIVNDPKATAPARAAAEVEARALLTRVGEDRVAKALNDAEIAPRKEVQQLRASRKAASKRLREATQEVERQRDRINLVADLLKGEQQAEAKTVFHYTTPQSPIMVHHLTRGRLAERETMLNLTDEMKIEKAESLAAGKPTEDGQFDIGLDTPVPGALRVMVELEDGNYTEMSIADVFKDFEDDMRLEEAVRSCAL